MNQRAALIIGITGQVGPYLARFLLSKGYVVHGTSRDGALARLDGCVALGIREKLTIHSLSLLDVRSMTQIIERLALCEIYNLTGQSSVGLSFDQPTETLQSIVFGTLNLLEVLRAMRSDIRFYSAGSSECFGDTGIHLANEETPFRPQSPYGIAKAAAVSLVRNYREAYGLFACSGLAFNHESPLRPTRFVTRKITAAVARIMQGSQERLALGDLSIRRDWGWTPDYVEAMWAMLQQKSADDFVIASGVSHTLEQFVSTAFAAAGRNWHDRVDYDPLLKRPTDIANSAGDPAKAKMRLCWQAKLTFSEIIDRMIRAEQEGVAAVS